MKVYDNQNMQALFAVSSMSLIAPDSILHMSWDCCVGLSVHVVMRTSKLFIWSVDLVDPLKKELVREKVHNPYI